MAGAFDQFPVADPWSQFPKVEPGKAEAFPGLSQEATDRVRGTYPKLPSAHEFMSRMDETVRNVARGTPFGSIGDEENAVIDALLAIPFDELNNLTGRQYRDPETRKILESNQSFGDRVSALTQRDRAKDQASDERHPIVNALLGLTGGAASGLGVAKAAPAVFQTMFGGGKGLMDAATRSAITSALLSYGNRFGNRTGSAAERHQGWFGPTAISAAVGGAVPFLAKGISDYVVPAVKKTGLFGNFDEAFTQAQQQAARTVQEAAARDTAVTGNKPSVPLINQGAPGARNIQSLARDVASQPDEAGTEMLKAVQAPGISPEARTVITGAGDAASGTWAAAARGRGPASPTGVVESLANLPFASVFNKGPGSAVKDVASAIGRKFSQGAMDKASIEMVKMLTGADPAIIDEFTRMAAAQAVNEAQRNAMETIIKGIITPNVAYRPVGQEVVQ